MNQTMYPNQSNIPMAAVLLYLSCSITVGILAQTDIVTTFCPTDVELQERYITVDIFNNLLSVFLHELENRAQTLIRQWLVRLFAQTTLRSVCLFWRRKGDLEKRT